MENKLILFQKLYDLVLWLYPLVNRFPKHQRSVLGRQIEELAIAMLLTIVSANKAKGTKRQRLQQTLSDELDSLRILIRLAKDLRFMSVKQYAYCAEKLNEVGKILSGWSKVSIPTRKRPLAKSEENLRLFD